MRGGEPKTQDPTLKPEVAMRKSENQTATSVAHHEPSRYFQVDFHTSVANGTDS